MDGALACLQVVDSVVGNLARSSPRAGAETPSIASRVGLIKLSRSHTSLAFAATSVRNAIRTPNLVLRGVVRALVISARMASCHGLWAAEE
jgi:hypothetical protein